MAYNPKDPAVEMMRGYVNEAPPLEDIFMVKEKVALVTGGTSGLGFNVALRLLQDVKQLVLTYRWVAIRYAGEDLKEELIGNTNQSIAAVTPTIVVGAKESYFFQIKYNNMKPCSVAYELTEPGSGEITTDGIYTAPAKEGVYEIRIYCTDKPLICTYAYAIVKKKVTEEQPEE